MDYEAWQPNAHSVEPEGSTDLVEVSYGAVKSAEVPAPMLILDAEASAQFAWEEFIFGSIRNLNTRANYERAIRKFLGHCEQLGKSLRQISPRDVGDYLDGSKEYSTATKKLHLSAIRRFFDKLVLRHAIVLNPAASVRAEKLRVKEGKTPEISVQLCRRLLTSIDCDQLVGKRDKAIIAILIYTAARVGAVAELRRGDFYDDGEQFYFRFKEKGGTSREIPARLDLQRMLQSYLADSGLDYADKSSPLFRTAIRRTQRLTQNGMSRNDICRMVKRRMKNAKISERFSPHSFRVTAITDLLKQNVPLSDVQNLAGHADPRTTRLYDRRGRDVTRNIVERISV
ncbi:MAG: tyrosine-type recombinase/integrase [Planctomycetota bacterium]